MSFRRANNSSSMETSSEATHSVLKLANVSGKDLTNSSLPADIITDIFSRLPVKSVFRMECLSKYYHSSLSKDPNFVRSHLQQSSRLCPSLIVQKHDCVSLIQSQGDKIIAKEVTLPPDTDYSKSHKTFEIAASCNGIVLLVVASRCWWWNPSTLTFLEVPNDPYSSPSPDGERFRVREASWGFGYCSESLEYKVVRICKYMYTKRIYAEVISVDTDCVWRSVDFSGFKICNEYGVCLNGNIYWHEDEDAILTFDLAKEKFAWISCPTNVTGVIMVFKGSLAICDFNYRETLCTLWVLKDDSWIIHCSVDFYPINPRPLQFWNDHQLLLREARSHLGDFGLAYYSCFLYDFDTNEIEEIPHLFHQLGETYYNFAESLVPFPDKEHSSKNDSD